MTAHRSIIRFAIVCIALLAAACSAPAPAQTPAVEIAVPTSIPIASIPATPTSTTRVASPQRTPAVRTPVTSSDTITLTLWTVEDVAPGTTPAGRILRNQFDAFGAANPNIHIDTRTLKSYGKGGLLDLLTTTQSVMPGRLPDLVVMDMSEVPLAFDAGLLQNLDALSPGDPDWFPYATQAARYQNHWVSIPFAADIEHLVYDKRIVRKPPQSWDDFTKQKSTLLLPLGGDDAFLLQYFAFGATLTDASGKVVVDPNAAAQALGLFKRAHDLDLIPPSALNVKTVDEVWSAFVAGQAPMAQVSSSRYMADRSRAPNASFAAVPTRDGKSASIAAGWSFGLVTRDPARQAAALTFIQWIVQGERLAPWLRAAHLLPANRATVTLAVDPPDYAGFVREQMERAVALPPASAYARRSDAWRGAITAVWNGQLTPEEAGRNAASR